MLATKTEVNAFITHLAEEAFLSGSELARLRWKWLLNPSQESVHALNTKLVGEFSQPSESLLDLENTIRWIALFDSTFAHRKVTFPETARKTSSAFAQAENQLIRYLSATRDGEPSAKLETSVFSTFEIGQTEGTSSLLQALDQLTLPHEKVSSSELAINLAHWEIQAHGKKIISKALCVFIELLRTNVSVSFEDLLMASYDIPHYDESVHYQKIQNLISRLRALSSDFIIHTKQGRIYSSIKWDRVFIQPVNSHQKSVKNGNLAQVFFSIENKNKTKKAPARICLSKLKETLVKDFSRVDFEKATGFPRSTASRFLKNWLGKEILEKSGAGKATTYVFRNWTR